MYRRTTLWMATSTVIAISNSERSSSSRTLSGAVQGGDLRISRPFSFLESGLQAGSRFEDFRFTERLPYNLQSNRHAQLTGPTGERERGHTQHIERPHEP